METKLIPEADHAAHFRTFIQRLAQKFEPIQIFSFSQNSCLHQWQGCFHDHQIDFKYDYCLLVLTATATRIDYEMQDFANTHYQQGTVTIIAHGKPIVMDAVMDNSRFFINVLTHGKLHYSHDGLCERYPIPPFVPKMAACKALKHYEHRMPLADGFLLCALQCLEQAQFGICAFMLHQAVEQACICLLRVYLGYRSEFHNLYRMLRLCQCFSEQPFRHFLSTPNDERLFDIMAKSYSGSRYKSDFTVARQEAECLYQRVASFLLMANKMCREKIEQLGQEAALHAMLDPTEAVTNGDDRTNSRLK